MLSREEARQMLQTMRRTTQPTTANKARLDAAKTLVGELGLRRDMRVDLDKAGARLDAMDRTERRETLGLLIANWGDLLSDTWEAGVARPYQRSWNKRAFRAPRDPALSVWARASDVSAAVRALAPYQDEGPVWLARWAPYIGQGMRGVGAVLTTAIDGGGASGEEVFDVLVASAEGADEIGSMGHHVIAGLLGSSREDGWEFIGRLLLSAQRQEGLRQSILEYADIGHPDAFDRILALVIEHDLARFSSAARSVSMWLGVAEMAGDTRRLNRILELLLGFRTDAHAADAALRSKDPEELFLALMAAAMRDAPETARLATALLETAVSAEHRFAIVHVLAQLRLQAAAPCLLSALRDDDLPVAAHALRGLSRLDVNRDAATLDAVSQLIGRVGPKGSALEARIWPWTAGVIGQEEPCELLLRMTEKDSIESALPHLDAMNSHQRARVGKALAAQRAQSPAGRAAVMKLLRDPAAGVREPAIKAAGGLTVTDEEAAQLELLLSRKAPDLRRGILALLANRGSEAGVASAQRLRDDKDPQRRLAGVELLRQLSVAGDTEAQRVLREQGDQPIQSDEEAGALGRAGAALATASLTMEDGLGLLDPAQQTAPSKPQRSKVRLVGRSAVGVVGSLDELFESSKQSPVEVEKWDGSKETRLLGDLVIEAPVRARRRLKPAAVGENEDASRRLTTLAEQRLPLVDTWLAWDQERPSKQRDDDGLELVRALFLSVEARDHRNRQVRLDFSEAVAKAIGHKTPVSLAHGRSVRSVLEWLIALRPPSGVADFLLDAAEHILAMVPTESLCFQTVERLGRRQLLDPWRREGWQIGLQLAHRHRSLRPDVWSQEQQRRLWALQLWAEDPVAAGIAREKVVRVAVSADELTLAHRAGVATEADVIAHVLGEDQRPRREVSFGSSVSYGTLRTLSGRVVSHGNDEAAVDLDAIVRRCIARVVEVELERGEAPSVATSAARAVRSTGGLEVVITAVERLGREPFLRGWTWHGGDSRQASFSRIIRATYPRPEDTATLFSERVATTKLTQKRLLELAAYAPQWAGHVEVAIQRPGLVDAVWWFHAHTKDTKWSVDQELRDAWAAETSERTPLSGVDLMDGACDVEWFTRVHEQIGDEFWVKLDAAAKYCSSSGGHTRAQLYARSMLGKVDESELAARISAKRHQDSVRALGLLPLPSDPTEMEATLLRRYLVLQEFVRSSRQFGSQRRASEKRATEIAMANLARTAGYRDPLRLEWAMEAARIADLAEQPVTVTADGVEVSLAISANGDPEISVARGDKQLKSIPTKVAKQPEIAELRARATDLRRQRSRIRISLKQMMIRGDEFTGEELHALCRHPLVSPLLATLVLIGDGVTGLPQSDGRTLSNHDGETFAIGTTEPLRVAHPHDLLALGVWPAWQQRCIADQIAQPFKQVFRELYPLTQAERDAEDHSARYAGHQIQPRSALALLSGRGWVSHPEEGVRRTFHHEGLTASLWFLDGLGTPLEMEAPTIEQVRFSKIGEHQPVPLGTVPPRLFSEVMRDLDLVVSVAHVGGVDPEASASTVEMRASLLTETARLLKLTNVTIESSRALIHGQLGDYSVHLGSAVVHRQPGGALCIVPVHSQHRGRLFLPFADDDPKTAEVVSKVLLLANDHEIKDPTILEQLQQV